MLGFKNSKEKLDAIRDMWAETGLDTDSIDVEIIVDWFDKKRSVREEGACDAYERDLNLEFDDSWGER